ncbi:MAG: hypothetical protein V7K97_02865 [Nostoc sp.]|uniref:hypothetical protein n=1 Tax=Nostoc sp. TaxID=1180 RepID=UPI002FF8D8D6
MKKHSSDRPDICAEYKRSRIASRWRSLRREERKRSRQAMPRLASYAPLHLRIPAASSRPVKSSLDILQIMAIGDRPTANQWYL